MEELRGLILDHLEELHSTGLTNERYQLYVDTVYQCETLDSLIELAALELQLEAHEFFVHLKEQLADIEPDQPHSDIDYENSDGFGDEQDDGFGDELDAGFSVEVDLPSYSELDDLPYDDIEYEDDGFGEDTSNVLSADTHQPDDNLSGFEDDSDANLSGFEDDSDANPEIDPDILAIQRALLGGDDPTDPDYFDIDALLTKSGSVETELSITTGPKPEYNDALADLLSVYPVEEEEQPSEVTNLIPPTQMDGFGQPVSFGQPVAQGRPSGFETTRAPSPPQQVPRPQAQVPQTPRPAPAPAQANVAMNNAKNVFAGFSKRKK